MAETKDGRVPAAFKFHCLTGDNLVSTLRTSMETIYGMTDTLASLDHWQSLKQTFIKLNTLLPANAACKRLFSAAGRIFMPRQCHIADKYFE